MSGLGIGASRSRVVVEVANNRPVKIAKGDNYGTDFQCHV